MMETSSTEKTQSNHKILFLYGSQALLERYKAITENFSEYGEVITPDLPGLGGMDSFYKIGMVPTIDNYADYVAAVIAYKFKNNESFTIVGFSFGMQIATNLLQRYPDLAPRVGLLVSMFGVVDSESIKFARHTRVLYRPLLKIMGTPFLSGLGSVVMASPLFGWTVRRLRTGQLKQYPDIQANPAMIAPIIDMELRMWRTNDIRTAAYSWLQFLAYKAPTNTVNLKLVHIFAPVDKYVDHAKLIEKFSSIYQGGVEEYQADVVKHSPYVTAGASEVKDTIPTEVRKQLAKRSKSLTREVKTSKPKAAKK